ncbi:hypothetical protein WMY93_001707 [Mugilogobius chulae]|uniref:Uncharacterized protein n=1 Tax=Mugilogobius chulae TaxID=88201 RepID=A0AAW0PRI0_9GOBI
MNQVHARRHLQYIKTMHMKDPEPELELEPIEDCSPQPKPPLRPHKKQQTTSQIMNLTEPEPHKQLRPQKQPTIPHLLKSINPVHA